MRRIWFPPPTMRFHPAPILALLLALPLASLKAEDSYVEGEVLVTFRQDVAEASATAALGRRSLRLAEKFDRLGAQRGRVFGMVRQKSRTTASLIAELKADPSVETVEPNYLRRASVTTPDDTYFSRQWGLRNTGQTVNSTPGTSGADARFLQAWNLARATGTEPIVGVIDSGVDITHPDLAPNIWTNPGEIPGNGIDDDGNGYIDDVHGYDFMTASGTLTDSGYHGTHIAGTVGAAGRNGQGVIGVHYRAKILPLKVSTDGTNMHVSAIIAACNYVVKLKQKGVNIVAVTASFGSNSYSPSDQSAFAALRDAGIVVVAAAGNEGVNNDATPSYPANYSLTNIVSVAAVTQTDALAGFSNYGATTVDIGAPGENIYSTSPVGLLQKTASITIGATTYAGTDIEYSGTTAATGVTRQIISCGMGTSAASFPAAVNGNIALIQRGTNNFSEKVAFAQAAGAVAAIIYNNTVDTGGWTLSTAGSWIPAVQVTQAVGNSILASLPATGTVVNAPDASTAYRYLNGTSMAGPHVAGAVAFAAWNFPSETMVQRISRILANTTAVPALGGKTATGGRLDLLKMIDTDLDGLPDWWEMENFGNLTRTATQDADGDGFTNLAEFLSGTSPLSGGSRLAFSSFLPAVTAGGGRSVALTFPTVAYRTYKVEWSETLQPPWTALTTVTGNGSPLQVMDANSSARRFYRLSLLED